MRIINVGRNDLGLLQNRPIKVPEGMSFTIGNFDTNFLPQNSRLSDYIIDSNRYYASDEYLQQIQQFEAWRSTTSLDMSVYCILSTDAVVGATMQQYIYANPQIASMYDRGLIGMLPQGMPVDKCLPYDNRVRYLEAIDGLTLYNEEDDLTTTIQVSGDEETYIPLSIRDQSKISTTWDYIKSLIREGHDPADLPVEVKGVSVFQ